jgi:Co/Zn/Cd efflux system component
MDPVMGILGAIVIARWSVGLLRDTGAVLLDAEVDAGRLQAIRQAIEADGQCRIVDLHVWRVGPRHLAAIVSLGAREPREPKHYRALLARIPDLFHVSVEVNRLGEPAAEPDLGGVSGVAVPPRSAPIA